MSKVYLIDSSRTPFIKWSGNQNEWSASSLAVSTGLELLKRQKFSADNIDECIIGCAMPSPYEANIARIIALRLGLNAKTPAYTVMRNCASGMQAIDNAFQSIKQNKSQIVLAGGCEAMSRAPVMLNDSMISWLVKLFKSKSSLAKFKEMLSFRPGLLKLTYALQCGLTDATINMNMGETAEKVAYLFNISRQEMDEFSVQSHKKLAEAFDNKNMPEITNLYSLKNSDVIAEDTGLRRDSSIENLAKLKPAFDKYFGKVTAGNSSQITDGASLVLVASEEAVNKYNLDVLAEIIDVSWSGLDPSVMGLGPVYASTKLLKNNNLSMSDIDYWEINEAFAGQVIGCLKAWQDDNFCRDKLGLDGALGKLDQSKLNIDGGAIACGHPIGATGARISSHVAHILKRKKAKLGIATLCIGGGQGGAILLKNGV